MQQQPYSFRDLKSAFVMDELRARYGGTYHASDRRWRFAAQTARMEARAFVASQPDIGTLQIPGLHEDAKLVKEHRGVFIAVRNDAGAYLHPRDLAVFPTEDDAALCRADAQRTYGAYPRDLELFRKRYNPEAFAQPIDDLLNSALAPLAADVKRWEARCRAFEQYRPPDDVSAARSRSATLGEANAVMRSMLFLPSEFREQELPSEGIITGLLVARQSNHVAILSDEAGNGYIIPRERLAFPMRRDGAAEMQPERLASIAIDVASLSALQSRALEPASNKDLAIGPLILQGRMSAGPFEPIVEVEQALQEDCDGRVVSRNELYAGVLDAGATIALFHRRELANDGLGARVEIGPSFSAGTKRIGRLR